MRHILKRKGVSCYHRMKWIIILNQNIRKKRQNQIPPDCSLMKSASKRSGEIPPPGAKREKT